MPQHVKDEYSPLKCNSKGDRSNDSFESDDDNYRKKRDRNNQVCKF